jgi:AraC-like DNA-binding protein
MPQQEHSTFWQAHALDYAFDALCATFVTHAFPRHIHEEYAIGIIESGLESFWYRGRMWYAQAGQLCVIQPYEVHTGEAGIPDGWRYRMIYPPASLVNRAAYEIGFKGTPHFDMALYDDPVLFVQFRQFHLALEQPLNQLERETRLVAVLAQLVARHAQQPPPALHTHAHTSAMLAARDYLHAHYAENISLAALAQAVYLSPFHLSRLFSGQFGLPPHAYLTQIRIHHARRLLRVGVSPAEVALATGFAHQSHLTSVFKRILGWTPGQYTCSTQPPQ